MDVPIKLIVNKDGHEVEVYDPQAIDDFMLALKRAYLAYGRLTVNVSGQWGRRIATESDSYFAPLAHVPGLFYALITPQVLPDAATALAGGPAASGVKFALNAYKYGRLPAELAHITSRGGEAAIRASKMIKPSKGYPGFSELKQIFKEAKKGTKIDAVKGRLKEIGMFGRGVYMAKGQFLNPLVPAIPSASIAPIVLKTPEGTMRIIPYLVYKYPGTIYLP